MILLRILIPCIFDIIIFSQTAFSFDTLKIEASLDTLKKEISGTVEYQLPQMPNLSSVEFQLFPNVYFNEDSPYLRGKGQFLEHFMKNKKWAGMDIDSILINGNNLSAELKIEYTRGMLKLADSTDLAGKISRIYFKTRIPEFGDRLSYFKNEYLLDGWFPNPAILQSNGMWYNPYYGSFCELAGEYSNYEVSLPLPAGSVVVAAAPPVQAEVTGDIAKYHYLFGPAHDFALAISANYLIDSTNVGSTVIRIFYRDFERPALRLARDAARHAYRYMVQNVGDYQYGYLNYAFVDFAFSGGLELPGLIALSSPKDAPMFSHMYESMVFHETAHQWFYGMIGSNQVEAPWMDEAVSAYFTDKIQIATYGEKANLLDFADFKISNKDMYRFISGLSGKAGIINKPAYSFTTQMDYFGLMYVKGSLVIETFDRQLGDSLSATFWREYYSRFLFKHPKPEDFVALAAEIGGENYRRLLESLLNVSARVDYSLEGLKNRRIDSANIEISVILRKEGNLHFPVRYCLILANGDTLNYQWNTDYDSEEIVVKSSQPATAAIIDPEFKFAVDDNLLNNSMAVKGDGKPALRLSSGILLLVESLLSYIGGI